MYRIYLTTLLYIIHYSYLYMRGWLLISNILYISSNLNAYRSVYKEISLKFFTTLLGIPLICGKVFYSTNYLNLHHYMGFFFFFFFFFVWLVGYSNEWRKKDSNFSCANKGDQAMLLSYKVVDYYIGPKQIASRVWFVWISMSF